MKENRTFPYAITYDPATKSFDKGHLSRLGVRDTLFVDSKGGLYTRIDDGPFFLKTADRKNQTPAYETNAKLIESRAAELRDLELRRTYCTYVRLQDYESGLRDKSKAMESALNDAVKSLPKR